jgi:hypothetical protein
VAELAADADEIAVVKLAAPVAAQPAGDWLRANVIMQETIKGEPVTGERELMSIAPPAGQGLLQPGLDQAVVFLKQGRVVDPIHGVLKLDSLDQLVEVRRELLTTAALRKRLIEGSPADGTRPPLLTDVASTMAVWQTAFNERDLDWVMSCYSRKHPLRKLYDTQREELVDQLRLDLQAFRGQIKLQDSRTRAVSPNRMEVNTCLVTRIDDVQQKQRARMVFINEDGEWRILREGF